MAIAKIEFPPNFDMGSKVVLWEKRYAAGRNCAEPSSPSVMSRSFGANKEPQ
jgi:hypothetical protein